MKIEQIYTGCLAEAAYYVESDGEAMIIDPLRDTAPYIRRAEANGARIKYILETHFHADFVSGHLDLARKTGATIVFGPTAQPGYDAHIAKDGEELHLGSIRVQILHTPGHTLESSCFLLKDETGAEKALFTGDTLFIGDVGRPDLVQKIKPDITPEYLAGLLYDSLRNKIMPLPDNLIVYPAHGAGSACGKNMSNETTDTLGHQKQVNYALRTDMSREEFIQAVTEDLVPPPQYFPFNVVLNIKGDLPPIDFIIKKGTHPLNAQEFQFVMDTEEALVIDTRSKDVFPLAFIPGSIFIGLDDNFAPWVGTLVSDLQQPILLITEEGREEEAVIRLARVGYDNTLGILKGGITAWQKAGFPTDHLEQISAEDFERLYHVQKNIHLLDVRREGEYGSQHLKNAVNVPLDFVYRGLEALDKNEKYYVHCAGGYRSVIFSSILKAMGFEHIVNVKGGYKALSRTMLPRTSFKERRTML